MITLEEAKRIGKIAEDIKSLQKFIDDIKAHDTTNIVFDTSNNDRDYSSIPDCLLDECTQKTLAIAVNRLHSLKAYLDSANVSYTNKSQEK